MPDSPVTGYKCLNRLYFWSLSVNWTRAGTALLQIPSHHRCPTLLLPAPPQASPSPPNSPITPSEDSFVQRHRGSCSNTRILLTANISHLIIGDVLFVLLWNVTSKTESSEQAHEGGNACCRERILSPTLALTGSFPSTKSLHLFGWQRTHCPKAEVVLPFPYQLDGKWEDSRLNGPDFTEEKPDFEGRDWFFLPTWNQVKHEYTSWSI